MVKLAIISGSWADSVIIYQASTSCTCCKSSAFLSIIEWHEKEAIKSKALAFKNFGLIQEMKR